VFQVLWVGGSVIALRVARDGEGNIRKDSIGAAWRNDRQLLSIFAGHEEMPHLLQTIGQWKLKKLNQYNLKTVWNDRYSYSASVITPQILSGSNPYFKQLLIHAHMPPR
jgi:hypothetical protein